MLTPKAMLFDLDGTLLDSAPSFYRTLENLADHAPNGLLSFEEFRLHCGDGARVMVKAGLQLPEDDENLTQEFLKHYLNHLSHAATFFPGVAALLDHLDSRKIPWGIVTNKREFLARPLLEDIGLDQRAHCVVCGDTTAHFKPHPDPLLHAAQLLDIAPEDCIYVGDDERDLEAAAAAGMPSFLVEWGYCSARANPEKAQATLAHMDAIWEHVHL